MLAVLPVFCALRIQSIVTIRCVCAAGLPLRSLRRYEIEAGGRGLSILTTDREDEGRFTCRAENAAGSANASAELKIIANGEEG